MKHLLFILALLCVATMYADSPFIADEEDAIIEVIYSRKQITDTTSRENRFFLDDVMLRAGKNISVFCGTKRLWEDSIRTVDFPTYYSIFKQEAEKDQQNVFFALGGRHRTYVYKDRNANTATECEFFNMNYWKYTEPMQVPAWTISDSTKNCLGYDCIMATTHFKGRNWIAWFTPEIPISDGPWKLCGLPGLILEAYDEDRDYEFMPKAIYASGLGKAGYMWYIAEDEYQEVSRDRFFKEWRKANLKDNIASIKAMAGIDSPTPSADKKKTLDYDREETDYSHE